MKKILIIVVLFFSVTKAKSQELLNAGGTQIKSYMENKSGVFKIKKNFKEDAHHPELEVIYYDYGKFASPPEDLYDVSFFLSKNKCYKYMIRYNSDRLLKKLVDSIGNNSSNLAKPDSRLKWINNTKSYVVEIIKDSDEVKNTHSTGFSLIYKKGTDTFD